ncbi:UNVERIFIED_CONTAM: Baicalein 7-O-glucuronosyltransferase [Sesamum calycinum]|uniref:Baicalein 7-O-glucuronosyltransferase n=1 Tax=Sesamum calycinum TaxID=2727403 RepID=A0AAW2LTH5_9LAMI
MEYDMGVEDPKPGRRQPGQSFSTGQSDVILSKSISLSLSLAQNQKIMEDTVVLYSSEEHLNSMLVLAKFMSKHYPSIPVVILCSAAESAAASVATVPSITYHRLPPPALPPNLTTNPIELLFEIPRLSSPNVSHALQEISQKSRIKAFVIDFFCNPVFEVSTGLNIPTYFYISSGAFGLCVFLNYPTIEETVPGDLAEFNDFVEVPGCPPMHSSDFPGL